MLRFQNFQLGFKIFFQETSLVFEQKCTIKQLHISVLKCFELSQRVITIMHFISKYYCLYFRYFSNYYYLQVLVVTYITAFFIALLSILMSLGLYLSPGTGPSQYLPPKVWFAYVCCCRLLEFAMGCAMANITRQSVNRHSQYAYPLRMKHGLKMYVQKKIHRKRLSLSAQSNPIKQYKPKTTLLPFIVHTENENFRYFFED